MLPESALELLTAAADGELPPADRDRCRRLLAESPGAAALYLRLKADRDRLRALPITPPPAGLHDRILAALPTATLVKPEARPGGGRWFAWAALAASVAVAAGVAVWVASRPDASGPEVAVQVPPKRPVLASRSPERKSAPAVPDTRPAEPIPEPRPAAPAGPDTLVVEPRAVVRDVAAAPPLVPPTGFDLVRVRVPFVGPLADLRGEDRRPAVADALGRDLPVRVDLFAKDPARGVELFQAAATAGGLTVQVDALTADRLGRRQATAYLVYTEALTPAEAVALLGRMAEADAAPSARVFEQVHAGAAGAADLKELKEALGADPTPGKRSADPKPLSAGTAAQLTKTLAGGKGGEQTALVLTLAPPGARTPPTLSGEVRRFLDGRGPRKPGAVPVLFVVRAVPG